MRKTRLKRPSPALVIAIIALLVAGTGTSYAAAKYVITSSKQVKDGSLTAADLSPKTRKALKGNTGARGAQGVAGPRGLQGAPGAPASAEPLTVLKVSRSMNSSTPAANYAKVLPAGNWLLTTQIGLYSVGTPYSTMACFGPSSSVLSAHLRRDAADTTGRFVTGGWTVPVVSDGEASTTIFSCDLYGTGGISFNAVTYVQKVAAIDVTTD